MTSFSLPILSTSLVSLACLMLYTLSLLRSGRLSAHFTVRWVLAEVAAILVLILWSWLPAFSVTSTLDDRELLVILAVMVFVFIAFLILDSLVRISAQAEQIKRLAQEIALLRAALGSPDAGTEVITQMAAPARRPTAWSTIAGMIWITVCIGFFLLEMRPNIFPSLKAALTAGYLQ